MRARRASISVPVSIHIPSHRGHGQGHKHRGQQPGMAPLRKQVRSQIHRRSLHQKRLRGCKYLHNWGGIQIQILVRQQEEVNNCLHRYDNDMVVTLRGIRSHQSRPSGQGPAKRPAQINKTKGSTEKFSFFQPHKLFCQRQRVKPYYDQLNVHSGCDHFFIRTPIPPPFSSMNITPEASSASLSLMRVASGSALRVFSKSTIVDRPRPAVLANSGCVIPIKARAARHCSGVISIFSVDAPRAFLLST